MATQHNDRTAQPLFDPNGGRPPADTVELYLEAPRSLGILYSAALGNRQSSLADAVHSIRVKALDGALRLIQREGGYVKAGQHERAAASGRSVGKFLSAQLFLAAVSDVFADGYNDVARLHEHVYVGMYGLADDDRQYWPVDLDALQNQVLSMAQAEYVHKIKRLTSAALEIRWGKPPGRSTVEVLEPPMYQHLERYPHVICPGPFEVRQRWLSRDLDAPAVNRPAV
jgi:hypothetical protein